MNGESGSGYHSAGDQGTRRLGGVFSADHPKKGSPVVVLGIFFLCFSIGMATAVFAEEADEKTVVAEGVAQLQNGNITAARHDALRDALQRSLEQGAGVQIRAAAVVADDQLLEQIHTHTFGMVTGYTVISEKLEPEGIYRVRIRATIDPAAAEQSSQSMDILKPFMEFPRVVLAGDTGADQRSSSAAAVENRLRQAFCGRNVDVVDQSQRAVVDELIKRAFNRRKDSDRAALSAHHADVTVFYEITDRPGRYDGILWNAESTLRVTAVSTDTAQVIAAYEQSSPGVGTSPEEACKIAVSEAAQKIEDSLIAAIIAWWNNCFANGVPYVLVLGTGKQDNRLITAFKEEMAAVPGLVSVSQRSFGNGICELMVRYHRTGYRDFTSAVLLALHSTPGFEDVEMKASAGRMVLVNIP
jgi:hypothetical protein